MKPVRLSLKNFGPFIEETLDFDKLTEATLFLISGKTGSGKTTIFDGMTFALFGETSGGMRGPSEMRSIFASPTEETEVSFTFEHQELLYQISRKPKQTLQKKKGSGTREQNAKVELTIFKPDGSELRQFTKDGEVRKEIEELLHLNAKQFNQIVLLPQGEFRTFLVAKSDDKETVLRNLFGTGIYQQFGQQLQERLKQLKKQHEGQAAELKLIQQQFQWEQEVLSDQEFILEGESFLTTVAAELTAQQEKLNQLLETESIAQAQYLQAQDLEKAFQELAAAEKTTAELESQAEKIAQLKHKLQQLEQAENLRPQVLKLAELTAEEKMLTKKATELKTASVELQQKLADLNVALTALKQQEASFNEKQETVRQLNDQLPRLEELAQLKTALALKKAELQEVQEKIDAVQLQQSQNLAATKELQQVQLSSGKLQAELKQLAEFNHQREALAEKTAELQLKVEKNTATVEKIAVLVVQIQEKNLLVTELQQEFAEKKNASAKLQIARLSLDLLPGMPCPVCGALEHPAITAEQHVSTVEIKAAEDQLVSAEKQLQQAKQQLAELEVTEQLLVEEQQEQALQLAKLQQTLTSESDSFKQALKEYYQIVFTELTEIADYFSAEQRQLEDGLAAAEQAGATLLQLDVEKSELTAQLAELTQESEKHRATEAQIAGQISQLEKQGVAGNPSELTAEIDKLTVAITEYQNNVATVSSEIQEATTGEIRLTEQLKQNQNALTQNQSNQDRQQAELLASLKAAGFADEAELQGAISESSQLPTLRTQLNEFATQQALNQENLQRLTKIVADQAMPDLTALAENYQAAKAAQTTFRDEVSQLSYRLQDNRRILDKFTVLYQKNYQELATLQELQQLSDTINGNNIKKTSLERFILQTYLQEVLLVANQRLESLTRGRYQFELSTAIGSFRSQTGLEINVYDDAVGQSRSAHTLSGGESFIAALALALALAEVIQSQSGGISIEALFIDEGFGSLDEDSLEMAMEALETIESYGRMIGIISHVKELKERIPQQILVQSLGNGQSQIAYQLA